MASKTSFYYWGSSIGSYVYCPTGFNSILLFVLTAASPIAAAPIFGTALSKWLSSVNRQQGSYNDNYNCNYCRMPMTNSHYSHIPPPLEVPSHPLAAPLAVWMLFAFYICQVFIARYSRCSGSLFGQKDGSCGKIMRLINMRVQCECATPPVAPYPQKPNPQPQHITVYFDSLMCVRVGGCLFAFGLVAVVVVWPANTHQNGKFAHCQSQRIVNDYNFLLCLRNSG